MRIRKKTFVIFAGVIILIVLVNIILILLSDSTHQPSNSELYTLALGVENVNIDFNSVELELPRELSVYFLDTNNYSEIIKKFAGVDIKEDVYDANFRIIKLSDDNNKNCTGEITRSLNRIVFYCPESKFSPMKNKSFEDFNICDLFSSKMTCKSLGYTTYRDTVLYTIQFFTPDNFLISPELSGVPNENIAFHTDKAFESLRIHNLTMRDKNKVSLVDFSKLQSVVNKTNYPKKIVGGFDKEVELSEGVFIPPEILSTCTVTDYTIEYGLDGTGKYLLPYLKLKCAKTEETKDYQFYVYTNILDLDRVTVDSL